MNIYLKLFECILGSFVNDHVSMHAMAEMEHHWPSTGTFYVLNTTIFKLILCLQGRFTVPLLESAQTRRLVVSHNVDKALKEGEWFVVYKKKDNKYNAAEPSAWTVWSRQMQSQKNSGTACEGSSWLSLAGGRNMGFFPRFLASSLLTSFSERIGEDTLKGETLKWLKD